jgi:hypothetical protein
MTRRPHRAWRLSSKPRRLNWLYVLAAFVLIALGQGVVRGNFDFRGQVGKPSHELSLSESEAS